MSEMNAQQRERFRLALLRVAESNNTRWGLNAEALAVMARTWGFDATTAQAATEATYLTDKGLYAVVGKVISPEVTAWRITAEGRDHLAMQP